jgi:hypothetical protein
MFYIFFSFYQSISSQHTTATVTHWTGRPVCSASTQEWAIKKFLYNYTDVAAVTIVGKVIGEIFSKVNLIGIGF